MPVSEKDRFPVQERTGERANFLKPLRCLVGCSSDGACWFKVHVEMEIWNRTCRGVGLQLAAACYLQAADSLSLQLLLESNSLSYFNNFSSFIGRDIITLMISLLLCLQGFSFRHHHLIMITAVVIIIITFITVITITSIITILVIIAIIIIIIISIIIIPYGNLLEGLDCLISLNSHKPSHKQRHFHQQSI